MKAREILGASRSGSEEPIARVAQSRQDIALLIELAIDRGAINWDLRVLRVQGSNSFGGGNEADEAHRSHAGRCRRNAARNYGGNGIR